GATARLNEVLEEEQEQLSLGETLDIEGQVLRAENISFSYDDSEEILKNITFEAKPNTIVAFAGPSGGGKSTIFSILERFYKPTRGKLTMGNHDIENLALKDWRSQIGFVSQDSAIMAGTIR